MIELKSMMGDFPPSHQKLLMGCTSWGGVKEGSILGQV